MAYSTEQVNSFIAFMVKWHVMSKLEPIALMKMWSSMSENPSERGLRQQNKHSKLYLGKRAADSRVCEVVNSPDLQDPGVPCLDFLARI